MKYEMAKAASTTAEHLRSQIRYITIEPAYEPLFHTMEMIKIRRMKKLIRIEILEKMHCERI